MTCYPRKRWYHALKQDPNENPVLMREASLTDLKITCLTKKRDFIQPGLGTPLRGCLRPLSHHYSTTLPCFTQRSEKNQFPVCVYLCFQYTFCTYRMYCHNKVSSFSPVVLKVVGNEKQRGSGWRQMLGNSLGPWRSKFIYNLNTQFFE